MKTTMSIVCLLALAFLVTACGDSNTDAQNETEHAKSEHPSGGEHPNGDHPTGDHPTGEHRTGDVELTLNDGKKWQLDDYTSTALNTMSDAFESVDASKLDPLTLKAAGASLKKNIDEMIQGCTMTGAGHDQLHVYLNGLVPAVNSLGKNGQVADAEKVQQQLALYRDYFE